MKFINKLSECQIILFSGPPLSGKTYLYNLIQDFKHYTRISDRINFQQAIIAAQYIIECDNLLTIDRQSPSLIQRNRWLQLARKFDKSIGIVNTLLSRDKSFDRVKADLLAVNATMKPEDKISESELLFTANNIVNDYFDHADPILNDEIDKFDYSLILNDDIIQEKYLKKII